MVERMIAIHHDLRPRHDQVDPHRVETPLAVVTVGLGDDHVAAGDAVVGRSKLVDVAERRIAHGFIDGDVVKRHLGLRLHGGKSPRVARRYGRAGNADDRGDRAADCCPNRRQTLRV